MTDNNNVAMNAETPETEIPVAPTLEPGGPVAPASMMPIPDAEAEVPVAPAPAETEAPAEQEEAAGTLTITVTDIGESYQSGVNIDGTFSGAMFIVGLAAAINAISNSAKVPSFVILSKLVEVCCHPDATKEEQDDEDKDV